MENVGFTTVRLSGDAAFIPACFTPLFSRGVRISACLKCSLKDLICRQLGLAEDYLENRIQTVFLNGHPVDDVGRAIVGEDATVALSAAMPGLAGAVLRKGGALSALRKSITYQDDASAQEICEGRVTMKLFNMTTREVGPLLLKRGIWLEGVELKKLLDRCAGALRVHCRRATIDGLPVGLADIGTRAEEGELLFLQVNAE